MTGCEAMATGHSLDGLMRWMERDEWSAHFGELLKRHLEPACSKFKLELEALPSIIGEQKFMNLWGCVVEDFLARDLDDGRNIVDDYLKRRGWKETALDRAYMAALRSSTMSLYEVSAIVPGESLMARDLLRQGEPVRVTERTATRMLRQWDRIAARVVQVRWKTVFGGGVLFFDHNASNFVLGIIDRALGRVRGGAEALATRIGSGIDEAKLAAEFEAAWPKATAAVFSNVWLADVLQKALKPTLPQLRNTDGDEIVFVTMLYRLNAGASRGAPTAIRSAAMILCGSGSGSA